MDWIGFGFYYFRMEFGEVLSYQDDIEIFNERLDKNSGTMSPILVFF